MFREYIYVGVSDTHTTLIVYEINLKTREYKYITKFPRNPLFVSNNYVYVYDNKMLHIYNKHTAEYSIIAYNIYGVNHITDHYIYSVYYDHNLLIASIDQSAESAETYNIMTVGNIHFRNNIFCTSKIDPSNKNEIVLLIYKIRF